jgi:hypothetical protein
MIRDKLDFLKSLPCPENLYFFFMNTKVEEIPREDLSYLFDFVASSISFFQAFKDHDQTSKKAENELKTILKELYLRIEKEHVPDVAEPMKLMIHEVPKWEGLPEMWEMFK